MTVSQEDISSSVAVCLNYRDDGHVSSVPFLRTRSTLLRSSQRVFPAQAPVRAAEQVVSPVEEAGVISQEQEEHRGGKRRHTGDQLESEQVSWCSLYALSLADFGLYSQPFSISRIFLDADYP